MDAIVLRNEPADDKCNNCSLVYITNGIVINGLIHVLVQDADNNLGCKDCSLKKTCSRTNSNICTSIFRTNMCHFEIK